MIVFIQLTVAGANVGPFNLYSNLDLVTPFASAVSRAILLGGADYNVTNGTTGITVVSTGVCTNNIVLPIPTTTTSTSTIYSSTTSTSSTSSSTSSTTTTTTTSVAIIDNLITLEWYIGGGGDTYVINLTTAYSVTSNVDVTVNTGGGGTLVMTIYSGTSLATLENSGTIISADITGVLPISDSTYNYIY